jgi:hypothetical protein
MDIEQAAQRLYEDESLTDELDDDAAQELLKWAETMLSKLAETHSDDEAFDQVFTLLRGYTKRVNLLAGLSDSIEPEKQKMLLSQMFDAAAQMGYPIHTAQFTHFAQQSAPLSPLDTVHMMTGWLDAASSPSTAEETQEHEEVKLLPPEIFREDKPFDDDDELFSTDDGIF